MSGATYGHRPLHVPRKGVHKQPTHPTVGRPKKKGALMSVSTFLVQTKAPSPPSLAGVAVSFAS